MSAVINKANDRRRSPRFSCGGQAKISPLPSSGVFVPGKILDLSLHGCRVDTGMPIDCGVRAEMLVHVNSASFRAVGEVKAIRGRSGAGLEFVHLSTGGKELLADLIEQLAKVQALINRLMSARRETDAKALRRQLRAGELLEVLLSTRYPFLEMIESSERKDGAAEEQPVVLPVNLFG